MCRRKGTRFSYDSVGRMTLRDDELDGETSWGWDTALNGIGSLGSMTSPDGHRKVFHPLANVNEPFTEVDIRPSKGARFGGALSADNRAGDHSSNTRAFTAGLAAHGRIG